LFFIKNIHLILYARVKTKKTCLLLGFLAGLLVYLFHAGVDTHFASLRIFSLFWTLMGLTVAINLDIENSIKVSDSK